MTPQSRGKLRRQPFFDIADRHDKWYGRSRLYASAQGRHETGGVLSPFSSLFLRHFNEKQRGEVIFRHSKPVSCKNQENGAGKQWSVHAPLKAGPPLDLSFWSFLTFLHHGIEKIERHLLWKFYKKIRRKSWSNVPPKLLACIGFLYEVVHKIGRLRKFNRSREIEFNFLTASTISMKFGTLAQHALGYKTWPQIF